MRVVNLGMVMRKIKDEGEVQKQRDYSPDRLILYLKLKSEWERWEIEWKGERDEHLIS